MKKVLIGLSLCLMWITAVYSQEISNIRIAIDPSCGYYILTFDLNAKGREQYFITVKPYLGSREIHNPSSISGSGIEAPTPAGKDLQIFWHPGIEGREKANWQFRMSTIFIPENMVLLEGGSFMMGSSDGESDEKPVHKVSVQSFMIGKYEVTQKEWRDVMGSNPSYFKGDNLPVEKVSWYDVLVYCNKLSIKEGLTPVYSISGSTDTNRWGSASNNSTWNSVTCNWDANGYRLPTEAEWEYAARGGSKSKGYKYSGSNDINAVAWNTSNSGSKTQAVGSKQANELGIYDMSGNVWEWCWDWYDSGYYAKSPESSPKGAASGSYRVLRGGSWYGNDFDCRVAVRFSFNPGVSFNVNGVRVARAIK